MRRAGALLAHPLLDLLITHTITPKLRLNDADKNVSLSVIEKSCIPGNRRTGMSMHMILAPKQHACLSQRVLADGYTPLVPIPLTAVMIHPRVSLSSTIFAPHSLSPRSLGLWKTVARFSSGYTKELKQTDFCVLQISYCRLCKRNNSRLEILVDCLRSRELRTQEMSRFDDRIGCMGSSKGAHLPEIPVESLTF